MCQPELKVVETEGTFAAFLQLKEGSDGWRNELDTLRLSPTSGRATRSRDATDAPAVTARMTTILAGSTSSERWKQCQTALVCPGVQALAGLEVFDVRGTLSCKWRSAWGPSSYLVGIRAELQHIQQGRGGGRPERAPQVKPRRNVDRHEPTGRPAFVHERLEQRQQKSAIEAVEKPSALAVEPRMKRPRHEQVSAADTAPTAPAGKKKALCRAPTWGTRRSCTCSDLPVPQSWPLDAATQQDRSNLEQLGREGQ
jgi:hypothetical protein